jgi:hypothetical protein
MALIIALVGNFQPAYFLASFKRAALSSHTANLVVDADQPAARFLCSPEQHRSHRGISPLLRQPP